MKHRRKTLPVLYMGRRVKVTYLFDPECERWTLTGENVPGLVMEGDSIDDLEAELPDVIAMLEDVAREYSEPKDIAYR